MTVSSFIAGGAGGAAKGQRVLIIGATGFIGQFIAEASLSGGRPTYLLVRSGSSNAKTIKSLQDKGAMIVYVSVLSLSLLTHTRLTTTVANKTPFV